MSWLMQVWTLLLLASIFVFPQLLGLLFYFRLGRAPRWVAASIGILAPAVLFVVLATPFLFADVRAAEARGELCGMPALGATLFLFAGTAVHVVLALMTYVTLATWRRN